MNNLRELINNLNIKFELSKEIRKGETANTYLGNYQNEKSILKQHSSRVTLYCTDEDSKLSDNDGNDGNDEEYNKLDASQIKLNNEKNNNDSLGFIQSIQRQWKISCDDFKVKPLSYIMIPIVAACVGYITNLVGVKMLFYPKKKQFAALQK